MTNFPFCFPFRNVFLTNKKDRGYSYKPLLKLISTNRMWRKAVHSLIIKNCHKSITQPLREGLSSEHHFLLNTCPWRRPTPLVTTSLSDNKHTVTYDYFDSKSRFLRYRIVCLSDFSVEYCLFKYHDTFKKKVLSHLNNVLELYE